MVNRLLLLVAGWAVALCPIAKADVRLPSLFGDNMVLQQRTQAPIWGWARAGERITITADWPGARPAQATAAADGRWKAEFSTPAAGGPYTVSIAGDTTIVLHNVLAGEVWVCSGQSNMEWTVQDCADGPAEAAAAKYPQVRLFQVPNTVSLHPRFDSGGSWAVCAPESAAGFSATAYYFGRELHRTLGVPIGLVQSDWGGTRIEAWMSERALRPFAEYQEEFNTIDIARDPARRAQLEYEQAHGWWERVAAAEEMTPARGWATASLDDAAWKSTDVPGLWKEDELAAFDGLAYFRLRFEVPADKAGAAATLALGPIDDRDDTYLNGTRVGGMREDGRWNTPRQYEVPAGVIVAGSNLLAVRVYDTGGPGGIFGAPEELKLTFEDGLALPLAGRWRYQVGLSAAQLPPRRPALASNPNIVTVLYNGMIAPLVPFALRGVIWYQGESNRSNAAQYATLLSTMIRQWREDWGRGDFPFYYVQIAPFDYGGDVGQSALLREAQARALSLPNTGMAVTMDIGDPTNIHPANKQDVGRRLALWALAKDYGRPIVFSGPRFASMQIEGAAVRIRFDFADGGLAARGGALTHFEVAGADRHFLPAEAEIDGDTVVVRSSAVIQPVAVRYGWCNACEPNLFNGAGLPAIPFRTDDW